MKKNFLKKKNLKENKYHLYKITKKLGRTFLFKFLFKITPNLFIPSFNLQILRYETCNRTNKEISKAMPWFKTKGNFDNYINLKEFNGKINNLQIIYDLASQCFYKYKKKLSIIKKANENRNYFYLILNGNIQRLNLVFIKKKISVENYLVYINKIQLLQEYYIYEKCSQLNKDIINIINDSLIYEKNGIIYRLQEIKNKAKEELINKGIVFVNEKKIKINSIDIFTDLGDINKTQNKDIYSGYEFYIGYYIKNGILTKGDFIGDLSRNDNYEKCTYICNTDCDIVSLDKKYTQLLKIKLYDYIQSKIKNIFIKMMSKFYILKDVPEDFCINEILPLLVFKSFKKGEKIISQFSPYEGIYLLIKGQVLLSLSQTYKELSNTLSNLTYANSNYKEHISKALNNLDVINEFNLNHIINKKNKLIEINKEENLFLSSNKYNESFNAINNIPFYTLEGGESLGFSELYDYKTGLYNFNAECISDEVNLFFISKNNFDILCEKKIEILKSIIQLVELRAKNLIGRISLYKTRFKNIVINTFKKKEKINSYINKKRSNLFNKINIKIKKENNLGLFKDNYLLNYFKASKFFDYGSFSNKSNKRNKFNNFYETERNTNKKEIIYGRTFQGFNGFNNSKSIHLKNKKNKIIEKSFNLNYNNTIYNFKNISLSTINKTKSEIKILKINHRKINKQIKRVSSLPFINNNFYKIKDD